MTMSVAPTPARRPRWAWVLAIAGVAALLNLGVWGLFQNALPAPDHSGPLAGLSYNGAGRWQSPLKGEQPAAQAIEQDLALLAGHTRRIRTYSAADQADLPALAQRHGLDVMLGAFLDQDLARNRQELDAAVDMARAHPNVQRLIVGNETQLTARLPPNRLTSYLDRTRAALAGTTVQVSTAEPWHVWLEQPQLALHVDFIAIHVLPYWEGIPIDSAVQTALDQIARVQARFPGRPVVVAEIGWPSNGRPVGRAEATPANQARFVRGFLQQADALGIDYFLIEAFDQPWKVAIEGRAGAYWGLWDSWRQPKFPLQGPVASDPYGPHKALIASLLGVALALPFLRAARRLQTPARLALALAAQGVASLMVVLLAVPLSHYLIGIDLLGLALVLLALGFIGATLLAQSFEGIERSWAGQVPRQPPHPAWPEAPDAPQAFISVHLACANEPPDMVIRAVESLLALDWRAFEVVVVDNNTRDPLARRQLAQWMHARQDPRLRFAQFEHLPGFKAGALNQALKLTHPDAQWVAVVDADYIVHPLWFRAVQAHLADPVVGVVQAPQVHRHWEHRLLDRMMNWETEGFFRIGMHHRHERNAIVQHGTMTLVRAQQLRQLRWNEDCICEDTELGLRLLQDGWRAVYVDQVLGTGLLPADFSAYARQRRRWAQGAVQIFRQHARALLGRSPLSLSQRYHFLAGWLPWLGDALHLLFSMAMIVYSLGMIYMPTRVEPPLWLFTAPLVAFFGARLLIGPLLYARCVPCGLRDRLGAALAGMALSHRVARGVWHGLRHRHAVFEITRKAAPEAAQKEAPNGGGQPQDSNTYPGPPLARGIEEELALLAGLIFCIILLWLSRDASDSGRLGWMVIMAIQSLPYAATLACRLMEARTSPPSAETGPLPSASSPTSP
jgi:exo-beta-1,3-glucanase (GH17 family)/cellulose synthase/poly-beta-1,6-N-acetylglucosamine synthase-like glycosyltransferase